MGCCGLGEILLLSRALSSYNRFAMPPDVERELLLDVLQKDEYTVCLDDLDLQGG
jgi:hypothetical protein